MVRLFIDLGDAYRHCGVEIARDMPPKALHQILSNYMLLHIFLIIWESQWGLNSSKKAWYFRINGRRVPRSIPRQGIDHLGNIFQMAFEKDFHLVHHQVQGEEHDDQTDNCF